MDEVEKDWEDGQVIDSCLDVDIIQEENVIRKPSVNLNP